MKSLKVLNIFAFISLICIIISSGFIWHNTYYSDPCEANLRAVCNDYLISDNEELEISLRLDMKSDGPISESNNLYLYELGYSINRPDWLNISTLDISIGLDDGNSVTYQGLEINNQTGDRFYLSKDENNCFIPELSGDKEIFINQVVFHIVGDEEPHIAYNSLTADNLIEIQGAEEYTSYLADRRSDTWDVLGSLLFLFGVFYVPIFLHLIKTPKPAEKKATQTTPKKDVDKGEKSDDFNVIENKKIVKPIVVEGKKTIEAEHYEEIPLGFIKRGKEIEIECRDLRGEKFMYWIVNSFNFEEIQEEGRPSKSLLHGKDQKLYKKKATIIIDDEYFLVLTSKAVEYDRTVWYRVEIES